MNITSQHKLNMYLVLLLNTNTANQARARFICTCCNVHVVIGYICIRKTCQHN